MNSPTTEKYNTIAAEREDKKQRAIELMRVEMERWFKSELGEQAIDMDDIINDDLMYSDAANKIFKLMLTGYGDEAKALLKTTYDMYVEDAIQDAIDDHFSGTD
jgi:DNA relaxase NicK